jgi:hypothetical protein
LFSKARDDNNEMDLTEICSRVCTGFMCLRKGSGGGLSERGNEPLGSIKSGEYLGRRTLFHRVSMNGSDFVESSANRWDDHGS